MKRLMMVASGILLLSAASAAMAQQDIAVQQDNVMRQQAKYLYGVMLRMSRGRIPYDQAAVDEALVELEKSVGQIATVFGPNPNENVVNAEYGSSPKVWQNKADFESKIPPVLKTIGDFKGKIHDVASLTTAYTAINDSCNECHETYRLKLK